MNTTESLPPIPLTLAPIGVTVPAPEDRIPDAVDEPVKVIEVELMPSETAPDHAARTHHKNSPSKLPYLASCAGFENFDSGDNDAAEMGTRLHEYMDTLVKRWVKDRSRSLLQHLEAYSREIAFDDIERHLMLQCVRELSNWVNIPGADFELEITVEVRRPDNSLVTRGHLDVLILLKNKTSGLLLDYKFGWVRVKDAKDNEQGLAYALGCFEKFPTLETIAIMFLQPRLGLKTTHVLRRADYLDTLNRISQIVERAEFVQERGFTPETIPMLKTGSQCLYCAHTKNGTCPARLNVFSKTVRSALPMEFPANWAPEQITTPEQAALARYAVERIEDFLDPIKQRAKEIAMASADQKISTKLANGEEVVYKIEQHKFDRSLGKATEVAEALKDFLTLEEILGCADLSITKLSEVAKNAIYELINTSEKREQAALEERHRVEIAAGKITKSLAEKERKKLRDQYAEKRITKKAAQEQFEAILTTQGLLTRPDGTVPQLRRDKSGTAKALPQSTK